MDNKNNQDLFAKVMPNHPHRTLYILLSVLLMVMVASYIIFSQINVTNKANTDERVIVQVVDKQSEEMARVAKELNENSKIKAPPTVAEQNSIAAKLSKQAKSSKPMTAEEREKIANLLNKK